MSKAETTDSTTASASDTEPYGACVWAAGEIENHIREIRSGLGLLGHLANSVESGLTARPPEILTIRDLMVGAADAIESLWKAAFEQQDGKERALQAQLVALKAGKEAPGSEADLAKTQMLWRVLNVVAKTIQEEGTAFEAIARVMNTDLDEPDAELIRLCGRLQELEKMEATKMLVIAEDDHTAELAPIWEERSAIGERLAALGVPKSKTGAEAVARAALAIHDPGTTGGATEALLLSAVKWLGGTA